MVVANKSVFLPIKRICIIGWFFKSSC